MFTVNLVYDNVFSIVKKDALDGDFFKKLPIEVYGFIRVELFGKKYGISVMNIAQEVFESDELVDLITEAKKCALALKKWN